MNSRIDPLRTRNDAFAESGRWRATPRLPFLPSAGLYVVTCVDPRTDPADFLGLEFGEAIVARAVGGRVNDAILRDLSYIAYLVESLAPEGPFFEVAVVHHTDCGTRLLERPEIRRGFAERSGYDESSLAALPVTEPSETVRADVAAIVAAPAVSDRLTISGHVYHTESGRLETVNAPGLVRDLRARAAGGAAA